MFIKLIDYDLLSREVKAGTQPRNMETGTEEEVMKECHLLSLLFYTNQTYLPKGGTTNNDLSLPHIHH